MFDPTAVILDLDIGYRVCPTFVTDQERIALRVVARRFCLRVHGNQPTIGVLGLTCTDTLGYDTRLGVLAKMNHLGAGIGLLHVVGDGYGIEFALTIVTAQNAGRVFPSHSRPSFHLCPHHFGPVAAAIGSFCYKVIDSTLPVFIARIPVLDGGILHLGVFFYDDFNHSSVQLCDVALGRGAPL